MPPRPTWAVETDVPEEVEYEVQIYQAEEERQLVAVIEIVSPANKDRPDKRRAFVGKCGALLRKGVAVSIVDLVTIRHANLYAELADRLLADQRLLRLPLVRASNALAVGRDEAAWKAIAAIAAPSSR